MSSPQQGGPGVVAKGTNNSTNTGSPDYSLLYICDNAIGCTYTTTKIRVCKGLQNTCVGVSLCSAASGVAGSVQLDLNTLLAGIAQ